jgi:hypothetical protein
MASPYPDFLYGSSVKKFSSHDYERIYVHAAESLAYLAFSIYFIKRGYDSLPSNPTQFEKLITSSTGKGLSWSLFALSVIHASSNRGWLYYYMKTVTRLQRIIFSVLLSAWVIGS